MLTVCNFHYIRTHFEAPFPGIFGVTPTAFENQLLELAKTGEFVSQARLIADLEIILGSSDNYILITFDDGLKEQFQLAKPILDKYAIPAVYYINSLNFIEKEVTPVHKNHLLRSQIPASDLWNKTELVFPNHQFHLTEAEMAKATTHYKYDATETAHLKYLLNFKLSPEQSALLLNTLFAELFDLRQVWSDLYMTEEQLAYLAAENMLGNHTHNHLALGLLSPEKIYSEILKTKQFIDNFGHHNKHSISYPYGSPEACQNPVCHIAQQQGYTVGFTMEKGTNDLSANPLLLKRFDCNDLPGGKYYNTAL